jgi:hypothetical protein
MSNIEIHQPMVCAVEMSRVLQAGIEICGAMLKPIRESVISLSLIIITFIVIATLTGGSRNS